MAGITRFDIIDNLKGRGGHRMEDSKRYWPIANDLYRRIFSDLGMPLMPDDEVIRCSKEDFQAGYDYQLGIDLIIRPETHAESTMQEKFLWTNKNTVTVEHCQDWMKREPGDWYKLKAQYYFVGYDFLKQSGRFDPWVLLDWGRLQRATGQNRIHWRLSGNHQWEEGALASFMWVPFTELPPDVLVASSLYSYSLL